MFAVRATSILLFNSIIYSVRIRKLRVAMIELTFRTNHVSKAQEIDMRLFGDQHAVIRIQQRG